MGFLQRQAEKVLWRIVERRSSLENPQTPLSFPAEWLLDIFNGGRTDSGIRVSEMTALQADAVLACVSIITKGISSLPLHVYEREVRNGRHAKRLAHDHVLYDLLRITPNEEMTTRTYLAVVMTHALLWGNSYSEIQRDNGNRIIALWPRNPARTRPVRLTHDARIEGTLLRRGTLVYHTSETMGDEISHQDDVQNQMVPERIILAEDMLHVPGLSLDGRLGQSTVYLTRQIIGLALATEKYGAKFFGNGAVPRGILELPGVLEPKALETLRRSWQEAHGGENQHKTAVLEQGVKYTPIGIDPEKSQFLATREYQRKAIAAIFQVPPHMIGEAEKAKSNVEQTSIEFLNYCLNPWLEALQQELKRKLFTPGGPHGRFFAKFDTNRLLYPDAESRSKYYTAGKNGGYLNSNDIREHEDLNPIEDGSGDVYWMPVNMQDAANPLTAPHIGGKQNVPEAPKPEKTMGGAPQNLDKTGPELVPSAPDAKRALVERHARIYQPLFSDALGRVMARKAPNTEVLVRCFRPVLLSLVDVLLTEAARSREPAESLSAGDFVGQITAYAEGMRATIDGVLLIDKDTCAAAESRRAVETFIDIVERRFNPKHAEQPRHPDGKWHDGTKPFFLMRHGTTDDDVRNCWSGWSKVSLNAQGVTETVQAAEQLRVLGIRRIISSPLPRSCDSAQRVATAMGIPMTTDWRLAAWDLGELAGLNEAENAGRMQLFVDNPDTPIPGGTSLSSYIARVNEALNEARASNEATGPILAVTHSSAIALYLKGGNVDGATSLISPGGVVRLDGKKVTVVVGKLNRKDPS